MTIIEVFKQLETAQHPVARSLHHSEHFKVLVLGFNKDMVMKEYSPNIPSKITVLKGKIKYMENNKDIILEQYNEYEIPLNMKHSIEALEDSLCLLSQG